MKIPFICIVFLCLSFFRISIGQTFLPLGSGFDALSYVNVLFFDTTSSLLYAGGTFNNSGSGTPFAKIAVWDGTDWDSLGSGATGTVNGILKYNNDIYAGGSFPSMGGINCNGLARWDGFMWHSVASFLTNSQNPSVHNLYRFNNDLYVVGGFNSVDTFAANGIAKFDGTTWSFFPTLDNTGDIYDVIIYNGEIYVGGNFNGGNNLKDIAKFDGFNWVPVGNGLSGANTWVNSFEIYQGKLYVSGYFQSVNGDPGNGIAIWDGTTWSQAGSGLLPSNVMDLIEYNNILYAGGQINSAGGSPVHFIAQWDGFTWSALPSNPMFDNTIACFTISPNSIYIGGGFLVVDNLIVNKIVEYDFSVSIQELTEASNIRVFPNPFNEFTTFILSDNASIKLPMKFEIYGSFGNKLVVKNIFTKNFIVEKDCLKSGLYFYNFSSENIIYDSGKIVIE